MRKSIFPILPLLFSLVFTACGDDSNSASSGDDIDSVVSSSDGENGDSSSSVKSSSSARSSSSAKSSMAISYGSMTDARDGQTYKTVQIGEGENAQVWMAENLNYAYLEPTTTEDSSSFCYNNSADSCAKYGRLYLWSSAMDSAAVFSDAGAGCGYGKMCSPSGTIRGICPEGWHLPSKAEWRTLFTYVGEISTAGTMLKSASGWYNDGNGDDTYGFAVFPAGYRGHDGCFRDAGVVANFWSSSEYSGSYPYNEYFHYNNSYVGVYSNYKYDALSVRCLSNN